MNYSSTTTHQSKLPGFEGVSFTVRKLTEGRRIQLTIDLAEEYDKIDEIRRSVAQYSEMLRAEADRVRRLDGAERDAAAAAMSAMPETIQASTAYRKIATVEGGPIMRAYFLALVSEIGGLEIDGKPANPGMLLESGPPELYAEIAAVVKREMGMSEADQGNSASPSTSTAQADGETNPTSAEPASVAATTA